MKKSQTDIIGLMVIIILLVIIGLIFVNLKFSKKPDPYLRIRTQAQTDYLMNALMKVSLCEQKPLKTIIKECYESSSTVCGQDCKAYIEENTINILKNLNTTLTPEKSYNFAVLDNNKEFLTFGTCKGNIFVSENIMSTNLGSITISLRICI